MTPTTTPHAVSTYDVTLSLEPPAGISSEQLEDFTLKVEEVLAEPYGERFGVAAMCSFDPPRIDIDMMIDAVSPSLVNTRIAEVLGAIEEHLGIRAVSQDQHISTAQPATA